MPLQRALRGWRSFSDEHQHFAAEHQQVANLVVLISVSAFAFERSDLPGR